eukprot:CAMPEP_0197557412 /NCGR_PEP_ID=MMETSP1320-20131121/17093_1 /TAXON_ID=91990 /ORGANISM="Bolidomonas sp., Strain RCC2347" /LENGTH=70 /DNA_ID=CAMNT_0043118645 /DNA_START=148 /DNA_END=361 /DNA_ORIENTATION=-
MVSDPGHMYPSSQATQPSVSPLLYFPAGQGVVDPEQSYPAGHVLQALARAGETWPSGHSVHLSKPTSSFE